MEPCELSPPQVLEALVDMVATLGELVATVTAPRRRVWPLLYPESLHKTLRDFIWTLRDTLDQHNVNLLGQRGVTALDQAMAALKGTPGATLAGVRAAVRGWQRSLLLLLSHWYLLAGMANELRNTWKIAATATAQAGKLRDKIPPSRGTAGDNLVAAAPQPTVALPSAVAAHDAPVAAATKTTEKAVVDTRQARMATGKEKREEEVLELLRCLVVMCCKANGLPLEVLRGLGHIEAALVATQEVSPDVPKALAAIVAKAKLLCEASARLAKHHLLVTLGEIDFLLSSPYGGSAGPGGPRGRAVAELCQRAIEDIPRLLEDIDVTDVTSLGQWCHAGAGLAPPPGAVAARSLSTNADSSSEHAHRGAGLSRADNECPWSVPRLCPPHMEPRKDLEGMVAVVAILGELAAAVTAPHKDMWPLLYPEYLHADLWGLTWTLQNTLDHRAVTSLCQALATLKATPRPTWDDVRVADRAWRESVNILQDSWGRVYRDALKVFNTLEGEDTAKATTEAANEDPAEATATSLAGDLRDETPPGRGTAGHNLVAAAPQPSVALPSAMAAHDAPVVAATKAREEAVVATRQPWVATRRQRVKEAWELLGRFLVACDKGTRFPWDLDYWLEGIMGSKEWTEKASPDDPEAALAKAKQLCGAEWLWEASARLAKDHLLGTVWGMRQFLWSFCGSSGGPGGPFGHAVAERCQRAIEDIPRLLGEQ